MQDARPLTFRDRTPTTTRAMSQHVHASPRAGPSPMPTARRHPRGGRPRPRESHLSPLAGIAAGHDLGSHANVVGAVTQVTAELDGDVHLRIEGDGACVVVEIIPELPVPAPHVGERITA